MWLVIKTLGAKILILKVGTRLHMPNVLLKLHLVDSGLGTQPYNFKDL